MVIKPEQSTEGMCTLRSTDVRNLPRSFKAVRVLDEIRILWGKLSKKRIQICDEKAGDKSSRRNSKFSKLHNRYEFGLSDGGRADIMGVLDKGISKNYRGHAESSHIFRNFFKCTNLMKLCIFLRIFQIVKHLFHYLFFVFCNETHFHYYFSDGFFFFTQF